MSEHPWHNLPNPPAPFDVEWDAMPATWTDNEPTIGSVVYGHRNRDGARVSAVWRGQHWVNLGAVNATPPAAPHQYAPPAAPPMPPVQVIPVEVEHGYKPLFDELIAALNQSQRGKGKERHANTKPFDRQPILELARMFGPGGPAQQVGKKTQEAVGMVNRGQHERAIAELHGVIVYAAATIILIRELDKNSS